MKEITIYVPTDHGDDASHFVSEYNSPSREEIPVNTVTISEEGMNQAIDDICVLEERIVAHYQKTNPPSEEIDKLQLRQRNTIIALMKGEK